MVLLSGSANPDLAEKIASHIHTTVSPLEIHVFPDGEKRVRVIEKVLDRDIVIVQPTSPPVNENYMELFLIVDAAKRSGGRYITVVLPYLGYQRQDHVFRSGEAVSLSVMVKMLQVIGVSKIVTFDLHSIKIQEEFSIPIIHLSALPLFAQKIKELGLHDGVLVSPDMGGIRRIEILSELLGGMAWATIVKDRDLTTGSVASNEIQGKLGKRAFIVDDMISSGGTIDAACNLLAKNGVEEMFVFATHPVFSEDAPEILNGSFAKKIFVTDSIRIPKEKQFSKLEILSISSMIARELI